LQPAANISELHPADWCNCACVPHSCPSFGISVTVALAVVIGLMRRQSALDDLDAVSDQWIADHRSKLDQ
jgi:hypothetical protein